MRAIILLSMLAVAGCGTVDQQAQSARDQQRLTAEIGDRVAGTPQRCLSSFRTQDMRVVGSDILFEDGATLYRARTSGGCEAARTSGYILVFDYRGDTQLCSGSIVKVINSSGGMFAGSCAIEDITPYRRP